jgi:thioredoxin-related protein
MAREVYADPEFLKFSRSQIFMRVFQDTDPEGARLARKFQVRGFPTIIILNSKGIEVNRILGERDTQELTMELEAIFEEAKQEKHGLYL